MLIFPGIVSDPTGHIINSIKAVPLNGFKTTKLKALVKFSKNKNYKEAGANYQIKHFKKFPPKIKTFRFDFVLIFFFNKILKIQKK